MSTQLPETILQFGTGKFLRCFADLFVHESNRAGREVGSIVVLQSTGGERARIFNRQGGRYHAAVRGLEQGERVDRTVEVRSVSRALAAADDWDGVFEVGRSESLSAIVSNTTEAGFALDAADVLTDAPPRSFPAKLLTLLKARFDAGLPGLTILPCELIEGNGDRLLELVLDQAEAWGPPGELVDWLRTECTWHNTLVDRIVSAPPPGDPLAAEDPLFAVAEPFALWLIAGPSPPTRATSPPAEMTSPPGKPARPPAKPDGAAVALPPLARLLEHPALQLVDRLEPYYLRKVRILNGAHTALVAKARPLGFATVREAVLDAEIGPWLESLLMEEIVPTLEGRTENPEAFARDTLQRFANPFLEHRLADIALHHEVKLQTRLAPTRAEFRGRFGRGPKLLDEVLG